MTTADNKQTLLAKNLTDTIASVELDESELDESESKQLALARFLDIPIEDVTYDTDFKNTFFDSSNIEAEYLILTDEQADQAARENILDSLWAFNASFLAGHCELEEDDIKLIQSNDKCEDNNPLFKRLIKNIDDFIDDAILSDGRGHFIAGYDFEENDAIVDNVRYYIYRTN